MYFFSRGRIVETMRAVNELHKLSSQSRKASVFLGIYMLIIVGVQIVFIATTCGGTGALAVIENTDNNKYIEGNMVEDIPIATQWNSNATGKVGRKVIKSVFLIVCRKTRRKGTGFLIKKKGRIITNEHVIRGCSKKDIVVISSDGTKISLSGVIVDPKRDLALLTPTAQLEGGLELSTGSNIALGSQVFTWGYPLGYNGPDPLLSVGYLSGYKSLNNMKGIKRIVVNGAFNPGNSGGPLFATNTNKVIGVVVSKHLPLTPFQIKALEALARNKTGLSFTAQDDKGREIKFSESQLVASLLNHLKDLTQVMIGEAIALDELRDFLDDNR